VNGDDSKDKLVVPEPSVSMNKGFLTEYWNEQQAMPELSNFEMVGYYFNRAIHTISSLPVSNAISVMTVGVSLFLLGSFVLFLQNVNESLSNAGSKLAVTVYITEKADESQVNKLLRELEGNKRVVSLEYIPKEKAFQRFKKELGAQSSFLEGLEDDNPLPASIELNMRPDELGVSRVDKTIDDIKSYEVVDDVVYGSEWVERLQGLLRLFRGLGFITVTILFSIVVFLISNTIRLVAYSRQDEIGIMRLVGATRNFVRIPFVIGGALQGLVGAVIGLFLLQVVFIILENELSSSSIFQVAFPELSFLSAQTILALILGGTALGAIGSYSSLGNLVDV